MKEQFNKIYWFCVGVFTCSFLLMAALLFIEIPERNREMASNVQGFLQGSLMMSIIGWLLVGSPNQQKKKALEGTTSAEISATITQEPDTETKPEE
ncbi:hypothetical protein [Rufibacter latericius]|uniref:Uncharacterized protein n=1 Tax=Rufibacter latericius TaxID=2487040 RepID=A0A3M9MM71_9BACT|nr:hypothetical protein [Rufibacter latericius]RNI26642.1 hypothetical protein EFB08_11530 [Rufibacter latericius]